MDWDLERAHRQSNEEELARAQKEREERERILAARKAADEVGRPTLATRGSHLSEYYSCDLWRCCHRRT
jgi:hypothetical protein